MLCSCSDFGAPLGSRKKSILRKQVDVTEEGEDVFFKLPGAKKIK